MSEQPPEPKHTGSLEPRPAFTLFDFFHLLLTFLVAILSAVFVGGRFGGPWGFAAFILGGVCAFFLLGYATAALVLFLHRRYTPQCKIGYEAACYVLGHFKKRDDAS